MAGSIRSALVSFLQATSIHGLRYLTETGSHCARFTWIILILCSFSAAGWIIYVNIMNWHQSPAVVTSVDTFRVEHKLPFPTLLLCQRDHNFNNLIREVNNANQLLKPGSQTLLNIQEGLLIGLLKKNFANPSCTNLELNGTPYMEQLHSAFSECDEENKRESHDLSSGCGFVLILSGLADSASARIATDLSIKYLKPIILSGKENYSNEAFLVEISHKFNLERSMVYPTYPYRVEKVMKLYCTIFDVFEMDSTGNKRIAKFKGLEEFRFPEAEPIRNLGAIKHVGDAFHTLIDWGVFENQEETFKEISSLVWREVGRIISAPPSESEVVTPEEGGEDPTLYELYHDILKYLDLFSPSGHYFQQGAPSLEGDEEPDSINAHSDPTVSNEEMRPCLDFTGGISLVRAAHLCQDSNGDDGPCAKYCRRVLAARNQADAILSIFKLSLDTLNKNEGILGSGAMKRSLLPKCRTHDEDGRPDRVNSGQGCWEKIITGNGICFTTDVAAFQPPASSAPLISSAEEKGSSLYLTDPGGFIPHWVRDNGTDWNYRHYDLFVTAHGRFAPGPIDDRDQIRPIKYRLTESLSLGIRIEQYLATTKDFRGMSLSNRKCLYQDEQRLKWFPNYSEGNCILECGWNNAAKTCGCVPWYLKEYFPTTQLCELFGNRCFLEIVDSRFDMKDNCTTSCLPDCEQINYSWEVFSRETDHFSRQQTNNCSELKDPDDREVVCSLLKDKGQLEYEDQEGQKLAQAFVDPLVYNFSYLGVIRLWVSKKTTMRILKTATMTAVDMISNVGGTLGLFSGFSLLSGIEIIYWIGKTLCAKREPEKRKTLKV